MDRAARIAQIASVAFVAAAVVIVGLDGSPAWRVARVVAVLAVGAGLVTFVGRSSGRAGVVTGAAGVLATTTGVGIGIRHLAAGDVAADGLAGLVALAAGLVLLVVGSRSALRGRRGSVQLGGALGLVVVLCLALLTIGQAFAATNVPDTAVGSASPVDVGLAYEDVTMVSPDGVELAGWYVWSRNGAAVVLRHGAGSTRADELDHAAVLARHGYGVLLMDARGHGDSHGRAMDFGWHGEDDIAAGVDHLVARDDVDPDRIGVVGMSMGGEEAIGALAADPRIRAVVAEGVGQRVAADKAWLSDEYGTRGWIQEQLERVTFGLTDLLTEARPPTPLRAAVVRAARPVLLVAAEEVPDEPKTAWVLQAAAPDTVAVWVVPGAGHTGGLDIEPEAWEQRVVGFLEAALR